jgi:hypothetical protein
MKDPARNAGVVKRVKWGIVGDEMYLLATSIRSFNLETARVPRDVVALEDEVNMEAGKPLLGWVPHVHHRI